MQRKIWPTSFGFSIAGSIPVIVVSVKRGSSAHRSGLLPGDQIIAVNQNDVQGFTKEEIVTFANKVCNNGKNPELSVVSRIRTVSLTRQEYSGFGLSFKGSGPVFVSFVMKNSHAAYLGIKTGDIIREINGANVTRFSDVMVNNLVSKSNAQLNLVLIAGAVKMKRPKRKSENWKNQLSKLITFCFLGEEDRKQSLLNLLIDYVSTKDIKNFVACLHEILISEHHMKLLPHIRSMLPALHRQEFDVLWNKHKMRRFRINLSRSSLRQSFGMVLSEEKPVTVHSVISGDVADTCGIVAGDVLLQINGKDVRHESYDNVIQLLLASGLHTNIIVERQQHSGYLLSPQNNDIQKQSKEFKQQEKGTSQDVDVKNQMVCRLSHGEQLVLRQSLVTYMNNRNMNELFDVLKVLLDEPYKQHLLHCIASFLPNDVQLEFEKLALQMTNSQDTSPLDDDDITNNDHLVYDTDLHRIRKGSTIDVLLSLDRQVQYEDTSSDRNQHMFETQAVVHSPTTRNYDGSYRNSSRRKNKPSSSLSSPSSTRTSRSSSIRSTQSTHINNSVQPVKSLRNNNKDTSVRNHESNIHVNEINNRLMRATSEHQQMLPNGKPMNFMKNNTTDTSGRNISFMPLNKELITDEILDFEEEASHNSQHGDSLSIIHHSHSASIERKTSNHLTAILRNHPLLSSGEHKDSFSDEKKGRNAVNGNIVETTNGCLATFPVTSETTNDSSISATKVAELELSLAIKDVIKDVNNTKDLTLQEANSTPPPPPPPPAATLSPPPPPPPPLPSSNVDRTDGRNASMRLKRLNWEKVRSTKNTIWNEIGETDSMNEMINHDELIELFSNKPAKATDNKSTKIKQSILNSRKAHAIDILLGYLKVSNEMIFDSILQCNDDLLSVDHMKSLLASAPDKKEAELLKSTKELTTKADRFTKKMLEMSGYEKRLKMMIYKAEYEDKRHEVYQSVKSVSNACQQLKDSNLLKQILEVVLVTGNFMNKEYKSVSGASGFKISLLPKLVSLKTSDNRSTLLTVILNKLLEKEVNVFNIFEELRSVANAAKVVGNILTEDIHELKKGMKEINEELLTSSSPTSLRHEVQSNDKFAKVMSQFVTEAHHSFHELLTQYTQMQCDFQQLVEFFGDDYTKTTTEDFFGSFAVFLQHIEERGTSQDVDVKNQSTKDSLLKTQRKLSATQSSQNIRERLSLCSLDNKTFEEEINKRRSQSVASLSQRDKSPVLLAKEIPLETAKTLNGEHSPSVNGVLQEEFKMEDESLQNIARKISKVPKQGSMSSSDSKSSSPQLVEAWKVSVDIPSDHSISSHSGRSVSPRPWISPHNSPSQKRKEFRSGKSLLAEIQKPESNEEDFDSSEITETVNKEEIDFVEQFPAPPPELELKLETSSSSSLTDVKQDDSSDNEQPKKKKEDGHQVTASSSSDSDSSKVVSSSEEKPTLERVGISSQVDNDQTSATGSKKIDIDPLADISNGKEVKENSRELNTPSPNKLPPNVSPKPTRKVQQQQEEQPNERAVNKTEDEISAYNAAIRSTRSAQAAPKFLNLVKAKLSEKPKPKLKRRITKHEQPLYARVMKDTLSEYEFERKKSMKRREQAANSSPTTRRKMLNASPNFLDIMQKKLHEKAPDVSQQDAKRKDSQAAEPLYAIAIRETLENYAERKDEHDRRRKTGIDNGGSLHLNDEDSASGRTTPNFLAMLHENLKEKDLLNEELDSDINHALTDEDPVYAMVIKAAISEHRKSISQQKFKEILSEEEAPVSPASISSLSSTNSAGNKEQPYDGDHSRSSSEISLTSEEVNQINQKFFQTAQPPSVDNMVENDGCSGERIRGRPGLPRIPSPDYTSQTTSEHEETEQHPFHVERPFWNAGTPNQQQPDQKKNTQFFTNQTTSSDDRELPNNQLPAHHQPPINDTDSSTPTSPTSPTEEKKRVKRSSLRKKESASKLNNVSFVKQVEVIDEVVEENNGDIVHIDKRSESDLKGSPNLQKKHEFEAKRKMTPFVKQEEIPVHDLVFEEAAEQMNTVDKNTDQGPPPLPEKAEMVTNKSPTELLAEAVNAGSINLPFVPKDGNNNDGVLNLAFNLVTTNYPEGKISMKLVPQGDTPFNIDTQEIIVDAPQVKMSSKQPPKLPETAPEINRSSKPATLPRGITSPSVDVRHGNDTLLRTIIPSPDYSPETSPTIQRKAETLPTIKQKENSFDDQKKTTSDNQDNPVEDQYAVVNKERKLSPTFISAQPVKEPQFVQPVEKEIMQVYMEEYYPDQTKPGSTSSLPLPHNDPASQSSLASLPDQTTSLRRISPLNSFDEPNISSPPIPDRNKKPTKVDTLPRLPPRSPTVQTSEPMPAFSEC